MELEIRNPSNTAFDAGYSCPCGCKPAVTYKRGGPTSDEGCCCGNQFAVGPGAAGHLQAYAGFRLEVKDFTSPWGEELQAAWLVGPSKHH